MQENCQSETRGTRSQGQLGVCTRTAPLGWGNVRKANRTSGPMIGGQGSGSPNSVRSAKPFQGAGHMRSPLGSVRERPAAPRPRRSVLCSLVAIRNSAILARATLGRQAPDAQSRAAFCRCPPGMIIVPDMQHQGGLTLVLLEMACEHRTRRGVTLIRTPFVQKSLRSGDRVVRFSASPTLPGGVPIRLEHPGTHEDALSSPFKLPK